MPTSQEKLLRSSDPLNREAPGKRLICKVCALPEEYSLSVTAPTVVGWFQALCQCFQECYCYSNCVVMCHVTKYCNGIGLHYAVWQNTACVLTSPAYPFHFLRN